MDVIFAVLGGMAIASVYSFLSQNGEPLRESLRAAALTAFGVGILRIFLYAVFLRVREPASLAHSLNPEMWIPGLHEWARYVGLTGVDGWFFFAIAALLATVRWMLPGTRTYDA